MKPDGGSLPELREGVDLITVPCPLCGSERRLEVYPSTIAQDRLSTLSEYSYDVLLDGHHTIVRCIDCSLHYACPRDSAELLAQIYASGRVESYLRETKGKLASFRREARLLKQLCGVGGELLEIGCATGLFLRAAAEAGFSVQGCDPWKEAAAIAQEEFHERVSGTMFKATNYRARYFRLIVLWDSVEHIEEPVRLLRDIRRLLVPGGWVALSTPNFDSLSRRLLGGRWQFFERPHLTFFSPKTMARLLRVAGFSDIRIRTKWVTYSLPYLAGYLAKWSTTSSEALLRLTRRVMARQDLTITLPNGAMRVYAR
jgi:2-polyprenyl-3-methyl-5-hydroxy-6-metoxy-1,4-benzoquinol methylase